LERSPHSLTKILAVEPERLMKSFRRWECSASLAQMRLALETGASTEEF
jgi:hypothetical protein